jgi:hypothetical protein
MDAQANLGCVQNISWFFLVFSYFPMGKFIQLELETSIDEKKDSLLGATSSTFFSSWNPTVISH